MLMNAEQSGDFLYLVAAMDLDKAMVGVTFSHDGYLPPLALRIWVAWRDRSSGFKTWRAAFIAALSPGHGGMETCHHPESLSLILIRGSLCARRLSCAVSGLVRARRELSISRSHRADGLLLQLKARCPYCSFWPKRVPRLTTYIVASYDATTKG